MGVTTSGSATPTGHRPPRRGRRASCRRRQWRNQLYKEPEPELAGRTRRPGDRPPWTWATTSTSRSARATCRPTRCRWRSPTRRSPTAATSCARTSGMDVEDPNGQRRPGDRPGAVSATSTSTRSTARRSSRASTMAAQSPGGTSYPVFGNFPVPMAGKTGTAQRPGQQDQSWYVALAPYPNPKIVVAATIEQGGFGVDPRRRSRGRSSTPTTTSTRTRPRRPAARPPKQAPIQAAPGPAVRGEPLLMVSDAYPRPVRARAPARAARVERVRLLATRPAAAPRGARADRLQPLHAGRGDGRRHPAQPLLLRRPPGDLRRDRASR